MILRRRTFLLGLFLFAGWLAGTAQIAPGAPGEKPAWTNGNKQGVGTSHTLQSKVWFTLGNGILNEVYYPTIDKANTRSLELIVTDGSTFAEIESRDTEHTVEVPDAAALVFRQVNTSRSGRYRITKTWVTDPERATVLVQVRFEALRPGRMRLYVLFDPAVNNSGLHDTGYSQSGALVAADSGVAVALVSSMPFSSRSSGYLGTSDGWSDLKDDFRLDSRYSRAADGNVVQVGGLPLAAVQGTPFTLALGFGSEGATALEAAQASLRKGFARAQEEYSRGWHEYLATLKTIDVRYRNQYQMSAMILKAHEDKIWRGAGAASLTIPWGDQADASEPSVGGYHLVWSRDLYQVATAFHAMGDKESADLALDYLFRVQQKKDGSFPQNSWLDGRPFWGSLQLDEVAYPLILAYQLGRTDGETYRRHVVPAANFIVQHGPATPQERWEEEGGYSPSTIAAEIAGLVCAAEIARRNDDKAAATLWLAAADDWARRLDSWTVTRTGPHGERYFVRIAQRGTPDAGEKLEINNGGGTFDERAIVDAGFLELVRLGIRPANDPLIRQSLEVVDRAIRVETPHGAAWYRYNHDGYGETADGRGYDGTGVGRLWILLAGERGEYALASGGDARPYLDTMQRMANQGRMLAEQVWDRAESPAPHLRFGEGTGSATPLAWSNAQFVRLAIAIQEGRLPETPEVVRRRYLETAPASGRPPRLATTSLPPTVELVPGRKIEIGGLADGSTVVAVVGGEVLRLAPGPFKLPVEVAEGETRVSLAAINESGQTAFEQLVLRPARGRVAAGVAPEAPLPDPASDARFAERLKTESSPVIEGPWVTFVHRGSAKEVEVVGEFTDWNRSSYFMKPLPGSKVLYFSMQFPGDARIEYKLIADGEWQLDPLNPNRKDNGVGGENNFFTMPEYRPAPEAEPRPGVPRGRVEAMQLPAGALDKRDVRVYLPPGYDASAARFPVIYFGDGPDYIARAGAATIADNLIAEGRIEPVVMVFVAPLDRGREYWMNDQYVDFLVRKLVPAVDARLRTRPEAASRAIAGASLGGLIASYAAFVRPDVFGNVIGQSSAFSVNGGQAVFAVHGSERKPVRFYLEVGRYEGLLESNRAMKMVLESKGYDLAYREVNTGHNWTHWQDALAEALVYLFPGGDCHPVGDRVPGSNPGGPTC